MTGGVLRAVNDTSRHWWQRHWDHIRRHLWSMACHPTHAGCYQHFHSGLFDTSLVCCGACLCESSDPTLANCFPGSLPVSGPVWHLGTDLYFSYPLRCVIPSCPVWTSGPSSVRSTANKYSLTYSCVVDLVNLSTLELSWQLDVGCMFVDSESASVYDGKEYC